MKRSLVSTFNEASNQGSVMVQNSMLMTKKKELGDEEVEIEEAMDKTFQSIGGCGLFQVFAYLVLSCGMSSVSWFFYGVGYLT